VLEERFEENWKRHAGIKWEDVHSRLAKKPKAM